LSPEDRILAVERVRVNQQGIGNKHFKLYQFKEALLDPMVWGFVFYALLADIPNGGITNFFSQLVRIPSFLPRLYCYLPIQIVSFGYSEEQSLLYGIPGGGVEVVALIVNGFLGDYFGQRLICSMGGLVCAIVGMILIVALPLSHKVGRLIGYYMTQASPTPFVAILSLISTNVAGYTKKTTVAALYLIAYCVGNIIGMNMNIALQRVFLLKLTRSRTPSIPPKRCTTLCPCRNHHYRMLRCMSNRPRIFMVVVQPPKQQKGDYSRGCRLHKIGESRVSHLLFLFEGRVEKHMC
jgi:hypothetical protein